MCVHLSVSPIIVWIVNPTHLRVLWVDWNEIEWDGEDEEQKKKIMIEALDDVRNDFPVKDEGLQTIAEFVDKFITVDLKDPDVRDIVKRVNVHHHTRSCR